MAELITIKGTAQAEGKQIKGYLFPSKIEDFPVPSTVYFAPNYGAILYDKVSGQNTGKSYRSINVIEKGNGKLLADNGLYLKWMPSGIAWGETQMLVSVPPSQGVTTTNTNTQPTKTTATMGRYKILKDYDNPVTGIKFYVGEVVDGTPSTTTNGMYINVAKNGKTSSLANTFEIVKVNDDAPLSNATLEQVKATATSESIANKSIYVYGGIGAVAGLGFAYYRKSSVGGYIGYLLLGSIVAQIVGQVINKNK